MHFTPTIVALVASVASVMAATVPETVKLFNGEGVTSITVGPPTRGLAERGAPNLCSGSTRCRNSQSLKNACSVAYGRLQGTTYKTDGDQAGVCDGHCGLFVQGKWKDVLGKTQSCTADNAALSNAYQAIQGNGCQTCGWVNGDHDGCKIKVDWVSSC